MGKGSKGKFGNIPANNMGSNLVDKTNTGHVNQPSGHSVGAGCSTSHVPSGMMGKAHSFPGANSGLKLSGNPRAHRIGSRK